MNYPEPPDIAPPHPVETKDVTLDRSRGFSWDAIVKVGQPVLLMIIALLLLWMGIHARKSAEAAHQAAVAAQIAAGAAAKALEKNK